MLLGNPHGKTVLVTRLKTRIGQSPSPSPPGVNTREYSAPGHKTAHVQADQARRVAVRRNGWSRRSRASSILRLRISAARTASVDAASA